MPGTRRLAVAPCPKCNEVIWSDHTSSTCPRCNNQLPDNIKAQLPNLQQSRCKTCGTATVKEAKFCPVCGASTTAEKRSSQPLPPPQPFTPPSKSVAPAPIPPPPEHNQAISERYAKSVMRRYRDAYWSARFTVIVGQLVKLLGVLLGIGIGALMSQLFNSNSAPQSPSDEISIASGFVVFVFFFIIGIIICAQGQKLKAQLDSAVYASPFITDEQRANVMSL